MNEILNIQANPVLSAIFDSARWVPAGFESLMVTYSSVRWRGWFSSCRIYRASHPGKWVT